MIPKTSYPTVVSLVCSEASWIARLCWPSVGGLLANQASSALGEVSTVIMCYCCNLRKWHIFFISEILSWASKELQFGLPVLLFQHSSFKKKCQLEPR